jgi:hypothetical protein
MANLNLNGKTFGKRDGYYYFNGEPVWTDNFYSVVCGYKVINGSLTGYGDTWNRVLLEVDGQRIKVNFPHHRREEVTKAQELLEDGSPAMFESIVNQRCSHIENMVKHFRQGTCPLPEETLREEKISVTGSFFAYRHA